MIIKYSFNYIESISFGEGKEGHTQVELDLSRAEAEIEGLNLIAVAADVQPR